VLWFFSILTAPLLRPVRALLAPDASATRLRSIALVFYGAAWLFIFVLTEMVAGTLR
jgi:hypothetical protein